MKFSSNAMIWIGGTLLMLSGACETQKSTAPAEPAGIAELRSGLAAYSSFNLAKKAGYATAVTDCMSNGDEGAMGVHFGDTALFDVALDGIHPEVLVYEPGVSGAMSLV